MSALSWTQLYFLAGLVMIGWRITDEDFRKSAIEWNEEVKSLRRYHPQLPFCAAVIATLAAVLIWPCFFVSWIWQTVRR